MKYLLPFCLLFVLVSCGDETNSSDSVPLEPVDYTTQNEEDIKNYIQENNLDAKKSDTGLHYVITELGDGARPTATSDVTVVYKGFYLNGESFDESKPDGLSFNLQQVIKGWTEGIPYFQEGGKGLLLVPAHLGYGSFNYSGIPGGSVLIFEIELISVD
jgi:FKBP-type peptidyl-prolyl cis-trans isomerase FkpA